MNELIKINNNVNGEPIVSARNLHEYLGATERFGAWFDRQKGYGFVESVDYQGCKVFNTLANQEVIDFALTLNTAKEISMLQRTEKGKEARLYFLECEKVAKKEVGFIGVPKSFKEALYLAAQQQEIIEQQQALIAESAPKAE